MNLRDIMIICADGFTGIKEAKVTAFPNTEHQRCIVHLVRNIYKYVLDKDCKQYATDLRSFSVLLLKRRLEKPWIELMRCGRLKIQWFLCYG